jgi:hypothetical protein
MPYSPTGPGSLPVERIKPITADWIGDTTAGGTSNIQSFLDARRFIRAKVSNIAGRNALSSPQDGDLVLVLDNGEGKTQLDRYKSSSTSWVTVAVEGGTSGGGGVMGTPMVITETSTGSNLYNLPYTREHPMVWVDGSLQVKDSDYTVNASGQVTFTPALDAGLTVIASAALYPSAPTNDAQGAMTVPAVVTANAGTNNATYALPGAGMEMVWKGGAIQVPGTDYTRASNTITFVAGNIPAAGEDVVISVAAAPLVGTDALTLGGQTAETAATANAIAKRDGGGVLRAANHASIGTASAAGAVVALDASGRVPISAVGLDRCLALGDLAIIAATEAGGPVIDYLFVPSSFTITAIDMLCPVSPNTGSITIDLLVATYSGGPFTSLYTSNTKPTLTCVGNASFATFTGANLPNTPSIAAGSVLAVKLTAAPAGAQDLYVTIR